TAAGDTTAADAASDLAYIQEKGEMIIGYTEFAPMNYKDDNGEFVGFETEFAKAVCKELGVEAKFQLISWEAKETELKSKNIDCIWNGLTITPEREEAMSISTPYMANKQVLIVKKDNADKYLKAEDMKDVNIVAEAESAGEEVAKTDKFFASAKYTPVEDQKTALMEVASGTADGCVVDYVLSIGMIGEGTDYEDLVVVESLAFADEQYGIAFRKDSDVTAKVNEAITKLVESGELNTIAEKYKLSEQIIAK
ncbi:MAG: transporter substrate-binding domain-containing protein, partial [Acutalibacteraceae bacterium]